jgi:polar amino acid transport system substrate-binding protein
VLSALLAVLLAGCSGGVETDPGAGVITAAPVPAVRALVPPEVRARGTLTAVMSIGNAPLHYPTPGSGQQMLGVDPDLARALGEVMGLRVTVVGVSFDQILPGLQSHRYDLAVSQMAVTPARLKVLDFVEYMNSGTGLGTRAGNPLRLSTRDLCGHLVGASNGSVQQASYLPELSQRCTDQGRPPIGIRNFPDQQKAILALVSGRIDAVFVDSPVIQYAARRVPDITVADSYEANTSVAIGLDKGSSLTPSVQAALTQLKREGVYDRILAKWAVGPNALSTFTVRTQP